MATWKVVGLDSLASAELLMSAKKYRSATSRFYYAAFALTTDELIRRGAAPDFRAARPTPSHAQLPDLVLAYFTHWSEVKRTNFSRIIVQLYRDRILSDYSLNRIDRTAVTRAKERTLSLFKYLGIEP